MLTELYFCDIICGTENNESQDEEMSSFCGFCNYKFLEETLMGDYALLLRLVAAACFGGIIGFERSENNHAAGLRTHIILCLGAAAIMVVSECIVAEYGIPSEIMRMGAQIISGVGFLGAGSIIVDGGNNKIRGITTAAGLWTTACLGVVVGCGYYTIALTMMIIMLIAMWGLRSFADRLKEKSLNYKVKVVFDNMDVKDIIKLFNQSGIKIKSLNVDMTGELYICVMDISVPNTKFNEGEIYDILSDVKGRIEIVHV